MKSNLCLAVILFFSTICFAQPAPIDLDHPHFSRTLFIDDVYIQGSECLGIDCVDGSAFGFITLWLRENNLRIRFEDTSNSSSFPSNDWELEANSSADGGTNHFAIVDVTGGKIPFKTIAGAPTNSLFIASSGRVGIGSGNPQTHLHILNGDTPTMRLEQDGSMGYVPKIWDMGGNESGFFIRDANIGTIPFRILPGAQSSLLNISGSNRIGLGTTNPEAFLHMRESAQAGIAEALMKLSVADDPVGNLIVQNRTVADTQFAAEIISTAVHGQPALSIHGVIDESVGTDPVILINMQTIDQNEVADRPMLDIQNNDESVLFIDGDGNVGIGTTPGQGVKLEVDGTTKTKSIMDKDDQIGTSGQVLSSTGLQLDWLSNSSLGIYGSNGNIPDGRVVTLSGNLNIDNNTLFIDGANNRIGIGTNLPNHEIEIHGDIALTGRVFGVSDRRLKKDIQSINNPLEILSKLEGKTYNFKHREYENLNLPRGIQYGLVAQDVEEVLPHLIDQTVLIESTDTNDEFRSVKSIDYQALIPILINAINEQSEIIALQQEILNTIVSNQKELTQQVKKLGQ